MSSGCSSPPVLLQPVDAISPSISNRSACAKSLIMDSISSGSISLGPISVSTIMRGFSEAVCDWAVKKLKQKRTYNTYERLKHLLLIRCWGSIFLHDFD